MTLYDLFMYVPGRRGRYNPEMISIEIVVFQVILIAWLIQNRVQQINFKRPDYLVCALVAMLIIGLKYVIVQHIFPGINELPIFLASLIHFLTIAILTFSCLLIFFQFPVKDAAIFAGIITIVQYVVILIIGLISCHPTPTDPSIIRLEDRYD